MKYMLQYEILDNFCVVINSLNRKNDPNRKITPLYLLNPDILFQFYSSISDGANEFLPFWMLIRPYRIKHTLFFKTCTNILVR